MSAMASQVTSLSVVYSTVCSGVDQRKHKTLRVTGLCKGNSPVTGEVPAQRASNSKNVSTWWPHNEKWDESVLLDNYNEMLQDECQGHESGWKGIKMNNLFQMVFLDIFAWLQRTVKEIILEGRGTSASELELHLPGTSSSIFTYNAVLCWCGQFSPKSSQLAHEGEMCMVCCDIEVSCKLCCCHHNANSNIL